MLDRRQIQNLLHGRNIRRFVKVVIPFNDATIQPPLGPTLGQFGLNINDFCKQFNIPEEPIQQGVVVPVQITLFNDKTFSFRTYTPTTGFLFNALYCVDETEELSYATLHSLYMLYQFKAIEQPFINRASLIRMLLGTLRSMHLKIIRRIRDRFSEASFDTEEEKEEEEDDDESE